MTKAVAILSYKEAEEKIRNVRLALEADDIETAKTLLEVALEQLDDTCVIQLDTLT